MEIHDLAALQATGKARPVASIANCRTASEGELYFVVAGDNLLSARRSFTGFTKSASGWNCWCYLRRRKGRV